MTTEYYVDEDGIFIGGFSAGNPEIPAFATLVPTPPPTAEYTWDGSQWVAPITTPEEDLQIPETKPGFFFDSGELTIITGGWYQLAHNLEGLPLSISINLICKDATDGYSVGDILHFYPQAQSGNEGMSLTIDQEEIKIRICASSKPFNIISKNNGRTVSVKTSDWNFRIMAHR